MIGYGDRARTQCEVVRLFRETHPDLPPLNQGTISKIEAQYREMGHVRNVPSKRQAVVDDDTKLNLLLALEENPITLARQLARDISSALVKTEDRWCNSDTGFWKQYFGHHISQVKSALKGTRFESVEAVKVKAMEVLNQMTGPDFQHLEKSYGAVSRSPRELGH
ncbi:hypothetical protein NQ318_009631 [Aromia moschata]|uniref:DUF4817 domain-containing protein n=1 Tax=Aromia moschata TaxID=1265417 RepID=A0AAV8Y899_9CUCU|nr:hypothetical protein NQ318_009631 [Aromia moschata]